MLVMPIMENNSVERKAGFLVVIVFLLGVALGGVGMHFWEARAYGHRVIVPTHTEIMQQMTEQLSLTPDQQTQIGAISDDIRNHLRAVQDQTKPQSDAIRSDGRQKIRALLTPDQQPKFDEFIHHLDDLRAKAAAQR
jgi:Spy/CpxP family protein refolding chaperone